jgi:hypothetical protein
VKLNSKTELPDNAGARLENCRTILTRKNTKPMKNPY